MNTTTAYTPLESLLLFQSLAVLGTDPDVFIRTSNQLKNCTLIRDGETYDPGRLSPDALRELYLQLLREELRIEASQGENRGDVSPSKKRKLQSPPIPTINDADEYSEKLPQLVDRLYSRYRDYMIRSIREDERKYEALQREIAEVERGEWDERILRGDGNRTNRTPSVAPSDTGSAKAPASSPLPMVAVLPSNHQADMGSTLPPQKDGQRPQNNIPPPQVLPSQAEPKPDGLAISDVLNSQTSTPLTAPDSITNVTQVQNGSHALPPPTHHGNAGHDRLQGSTPLQPTQRPGDNWQWEQYQGAPAAQQPSPYQTNPNYPQYPPSSQYPAYSPGPPRGSFSGPQGHGLPGSQPHVPSSPLDSSRPRPVILPPPNITRGPMSPVTSQLDQLANAAEQQYRAPSGSPLIPQGAVPSQPYAQPYPQYPPQYRPNDGRSPPSNGPSPQWNQPYGPPYAGPPNYNYPPPPPPNQRPFPPRPDILQPEQRQYNSPYNPSQGPRPTSISASSTPRPLHLRDSSNLPHTPASHGLPHNSTGKATRWTPNPTASTPKVPRSPKQPEFEPLSPIIPAAKVAKTPKSSGKGKKTEAATSTLPRPKNKRGAQRSRGGSETSSAMAASHRSQSEMSHADELSLVNESFGGRIVKQESATPLLPDDGGETTADESTKRMRSETIRSSPVRVPKRKRQESPAPKPFVQPTHVLWTRNFPKISASALERIAAHRHASIFAQPIKERDAPGYKNLILRPQDLKSIRSAVNAGYKAGALIASAMNDQGQSSSLMIPISEDLVPPKGIVNNAQLEKELMRMFANAIMFNHDPNRSLGKGFEAAQSIEESGGGEGYEVDENGVVRETRSMYADVEKIVGEMRSAEQHRDREDDILDAVEEDEVDQLTGEAESSTIGSVAKRRRRA